MRLSARGANGKAHDHLDRHGRRERNQRHGGRGPQRRVRAVDAPALHQRLIDGAGGRQPAQHRRPTPPVRRRGRSLRPYAGNGRDDRRSRIERHRDRKACDAAPIRRRAAQRALSVTGRTGQAAYACAGPLGCSRGHQLHPDGERGRQSGVSQVEFSSLRYRRGGGSNGAQRPDQRSRPRSSAQASARRTGPARGARHRSRHADRLASAPLKSFHRS